MGLGLSAVLPGRPLLDHLAGAAAGWGALAALAFAYRRLRGVDGIGQGDAKLLGAAGAWLGWRPLPSVILIACAVAFVWVGIQAVVRGRGALGDRLAFGAPLCLAIWIVWLHGPLAL
jgi:leader peptidase (prepilin peptidase)/N-methyltransferase